MSLRRPNFSIAGLTSTNSNQAAATSHSSRQLASFTRQCHKRISSSASNTLRIEDDEEDTNSGLQTINDGAPTNTNNTNEKIGNNDTSMEQCIILLEPSLKIFQSTCMKNDKAKHKKSKKQSKSQHNSKVHQEVDDENILNHKEIEDNDDEVPPQIIRVARFFPQRWLPTKRALLRAPPSLGDNDGAAPNVEVSLQYRLRLAKACVKKGLVAAAEYETLRRSIDIGIVGKKRKSNNGDGDDSKRYKTTEGEDCSLQERVKLSLMTLPTDAVIPERSVNAWRYVREMILECCTHWEKKEDSKAEEVQDGELDALTLSQAADWALTSWTALLMSQGMDSATSIEKQMATLLTDRSTANNPTLVLAEAIKCRINDLLSPEIISSLNGINLYSLGKLLASFEVADDAETHIILSVCKCSIRGVGLEQLARLLAVFSSCISTKTSMNESANLLKDGNNNTTVMNIKSKSTVKDLEGRLRIKLDEEELIESIPGSTSARANSFFNAVLSATAHLVEDS